MSCEKVQTMAKPRNNEINRRAFLKNAAAGAAVLAAPPIAPAKHPAPERGATLPPAMSSEAEVGAPSPAEVLTADRTGSDFMVDVIKTLGIEYICSNPGSSFRGLHESIINYGGNKNPEFLTCCHEESSVALAQGYAEVEGKPMLVFAHSTVGLQHASMGIYNAWGGRVPVYIILGNTLDATKRGGAVQW